MTIAEMIFRGMTAEQIGLSNTNYDSRKKLIDEFVGQWEGGDFERDYQQWVKKHNEEIKKTVEKRRYLADERAENKQSRGLGDTIAKATKAVGIKPCGGC